MSKQKFDTIRDLERKNAGLFRAALVMGIAGVILAAMGAVPGLLVLGIILLASALLLFFYGMVWMVKLQREPTRQVFCPYCASKNDVFVSRKEFACDICGRRVALSPLGEPIPIEPIEEEE